MKSRPILFSADMVRAILVGKKTQTRRPVNLQKITHNISGIWEDDEYGWGAGETSFDYYHGAYECSEFTPLRPFAEPGDLLWVRETFRAWCIDGTETTEDGYWHVRYKADRSATKTEAIWDLDTNDSPTEAGKADEPTKWSPSIHMPREASRITLRVTDVRVDRLQNITNDEAVAEGFSKPGDERTVDLRDPWLKFCSFWKSKYEKKTGLSWADNPWVWVVSFERHQ